jgi:uncharacterized repeat protein (TIGR01451 family)
MESRHRPSRRAWRARTVLAVAASLAVVVGLVLSGCDAEDNDWEQPVDPGGGDEPTPTLAPDLVVTADVVVAGDGLVHAGDPVEYTVNLHNAGGGAATAIAVAVALPDGVTLDDATTAVGTFAAGPGRWTLPALAPKATATLTLATTVGATVEGGRQLTLTVTVEAMEPPDATPADNVVQLSVPVVNDPPLAGDDAYGLAEGSVLAVAAPGLLENDADPADEPLAVVADPVTPPHHGQLVLAGDGGFQYAHDGAEAPADSFRYVVRDASAEADTAMVRLTIAPVNDAPVVTAPARYVVVEGDTFAPVALDTMVADPDHADADLAWQVLGADYLDAEISDDRVLSVATPDSDWFGADTLILRVRDPDGAVANAEVLFQVTSVNDPPVMSGLPTQVIEQDGVFAPLNLDNYVEDVDHADEEIAWSHEGAAPLMVTIDADRVLTVEPPAGWTGTVTFTVRATDPAGDWDERRCNYAVVPPR